MTNYQPDHRQDMWVAVSLFALTFLSRIPFRTQILYHWDSVNFAYAMHEFNVAKDQPQTPGYIVYVWLSRLVDVILRDPQTTLVCISIVASALGVVAMFCLGRSMFDHRTGLIAALLLASSPLFWFYGEVALPHTLDTLLVIASAWWSYKTMQGDLRYLYPAIAIMAVAGGVRQQTLVFLAPLLLFALRRVGWKHLLAAGALGVTLCLVWFIPLITLSGGLSTYVNILGAFSRNYQTTTSVLMGAGWGGVKRNVLKLMLYTLYGWSIALVPAVFYLVARLRRYKWLQQWEKSVFLLLWAAPALAFYTLIHMGQQGLVFVFLPALLLFSAIGLTQLLTAHPVWLVAGVGIITALGAGIFCLAPEYPLGPNTQRLLTRDTLANSDRYYQDRFKTIRESFAPGSTAILAANWHHVEYYLPQYTRLRWSLRGKWDQDESAPQTISRDEFVSTPAELGLQLDTGGKAVMIIFDPVLEKFNRTPELVKELALPSGVPLKYMSLPPDDQLCLDKNSFGLISR